MVIRGGCRPMNALVERAARAGVALSYADWKGRTRDIDEETVARLVDILGEPLAARRREPFRRAYLPEEIDNGGRVWGVAIQLYALRSARNWGLGDFTDLKSVIEWANGLGARYVGLNPLHALFYSAPERRSAYYPCSRLFLNVLYIDPDAAAERLGLSVDIRAEPRAGLIEAARQSELIDYEAVAAAKRPAFEALYAAFTNEATRGLRDAFAVFRRSGGRPLFRHALFEALHERFARESAAGGFFDWPAPYRDAESAQVAAFARRHRDRIAFHAFLQWIALDQLERAVAAGAHGAAPTELYLDLAVGAAPDGAEIWSDRNIGVAGVRLGAPPDALGPQGQDWGLAPMNPHRLAETGFAAYRRVLRASMRAAGALRIDHALGLNRQYWIPAGASADKGGYVFFPQSDMISVAAQESRKARCLLVGEDLGTVPEGLTRALHDSRILSYEIVRWARDADGAPRAAETYPHLSLAAATTHDLAPIMGWLKERDLDLRERLGLAAPGDDARKERAREREDLLRLWGVGADEPPESIVAAAHAFLGRTRAAVAMVALEDILLERDQANLPGTVDEHPNWRRRYGRAVEDWTKDRDVAALAMAARRS